MMGGMTEDEPMATIFALAKQIDVLQAELICVCRLLVYLGRHAEDGNYCEICEVVARARKIAAARKGEDIMADEIDRFRAELAACRRAINDMLIGIDVHNQRITPGKPAERIEGPVVDALRVAARKGEGGKC